jgi:uncharacterized protein YozE (UPF0346 family)
VKKKITEKLMEQYKGVLYEQEKSEATIKKYMCDLRKLLQYADGRELDKRLVIDYTCFFMEEYDYLNPRYCQKKAPYFERLEKNLDELESQIQIDSRSKKILVLGTEEFMFYGVLFGSRLEKKGFSVKFHATTRSPIMVSDNKEYPLHSRYDICSFYEENRQTYIYNLEKYDEVYILTDSPSISSEAIGDIAAALGNAGCKKINVIRWTGE